MKNKFKNICILAPLAIVVLSGCYKEDFGKCPSQITVVADWSGNLSGKANPFSYKVDIGEFEAVLEGDVNPYPHWLEPGSYHINAFNTPAGFSFNGYTASVTQTAPGFITSAPGWLFSCTGDLEDTKKGTDYTVTLPMVQRTKRLDIVFDMEGGDITDHVRAVESAVITGIASRIDLESGTISQAASIAPGFSTGTGRFFSSSRVLGIIGSAQTITLQLTLADGAEQAIEVDIAGDIAGLNNSLTLEKTIRIEVHSVSDISGEIESWTVTDGYAGSLD